MLIRRISESLKNQNWTAVGLDLIVVVLGIFLGLQVSQWYEGRQELALKESILQRLESEFTEIANEAESAIQFHQDVILALEVVNQSVKSGQVNASDEGQFRTGLQRAMNYDLGSGRSGTYVEILSSGQFRLIQDQELRSALSKYDDRVSKADALFSIFQDKQREYEPVLDRYITYAATERRESDALPTGQYFSHSEISAYDIEAMALDVEFHSATRRLIDYHVNFQFWHGRISGSAQQVLSLVESTKN